MERCRGVSNYEISQDAITKAGCGVCMIRMWVRHPIEQLEEPTVNRLYRYKNERRYGLNNKDGDTRWTGH